MRAGWMWIFSSLIGCSEYEFSAEKDSELGVDEDVEPPDDETGVDDTAEPSDTGDDQDTDPNNETEPPPAEAPVYAHDPNTLFEVKPGSGERVPLGEFSIDGQPVGDSFIDIAIDLDGNMFGATFLALYQINPTNAVAKKLCDVDLDMVAMTFSSDGELFVGGSDGIQIVNVVNCRATPLAVGGGYQTSGDLVGLPDGYLYWTVRGSSRDELVRVDPLSGQTTWIGSIGFSQIFGLGYDDGVLYGFNSYGETISIDPRTAAASSLVSDGDISWYGATTNPVQW